MDKFINKLVEASDEWITEKGRKDKTIFTGIIQNVLSQFPSPLNEQLSNNSKIINLLWNKIQSKYEQSSKQQIKFFFSDADISEYLQNEKDIKKIKNALKSDAASLQHLNNPINPFFKSYNKISFKEINDSLDILLNSKKCSDEWLSLIQYRFNQLLITLKNEKNLNKTLKKNIRLLYQKLFRLFCYNLGNQKNIQSLNSVGLLFNKILLICKDDIIYTDLSMNIVTFIRILFEYKNESKQIEKNINIKLLTSKLLQTIKSRYSRSNQWSNTQQLIFLWTVYECNQNNNINKKCLFDLLKWSETMWSFNGLEVIFSDKSLNSFSDFTDNIYQHNMMTLHQNDNEDEDDDDDEDDDINIEDDEDIATKDILDFVSETALIENINDMEDDELFIMDTNKRSINDSSNNIDIEEPPTKKQKLG